MKEPEYRRLKRKIETECDEKLRALDMVYKISGGSTTRNGEGSGRTSKGVVSQAVTSAIAKMTGTFGVVEIERQIKADDATANYKRASISSQLKRMADDEDTITLVEKGKGKRATSYKKK